MNKCFTLFLLSVFASYLQPAFAASIKSSHPCKPNVQGTLTPIVPDINLEKNQPQKKELRQKRKAFKKEFKQTVKEWKKARTADAETWVMIIIAILLPPLAMALYDGISHRFWISLLLTLLFYLPGLIYTLIIVLGGK